MKNELNTEVLAKRMEHQEILKHCKPGEAVILERLPDNDAEKNGIRVKRISGEVLGYLGPGACNMLAPEIDKGTKIYASISTLEGGGFFKRKPWTCSITVVWNQEG